MDPRSLRVVFLDFEMIRKYAPSIILSWLLVQAVIDNQRMKKCYELTGDIAYQFVNGEMYCKKREAFVASRSIR